MLRTERAPAPLGLRDEKVHRHHSASARETHAGGELVQSPGGDLHGPGNPATTTKSGLQIEAEKLSQEIQTPSRSGLMAPGVENQCRASRSLLVLVD